MLLILNRFVLDSGVGFTYHSVSRTRAEPEGQGAMLYER